MKYFISHRGNLTGPHPQTENTPQQIEKCISLGFDVEIDLRIEDGKLKLGHDFGEHTITEEWLLSSNIKEKVWIHCKNLEALEWCSLFNDINYFWHQTDDYTLTSFNFIWTYPGKKLSQSSISVLPEMSVDVVNFEKCFGVCSDYAYDIREGRYSLNSETGKLSIIAID